MGSSSELVCLLLLVAVASHIVGGSPGDEEDGAAADALAAAAILAAAAVRTQRTPKQARQRLFPPPVAGGFDRGVSAGGRGNRGGGCLAGSQTASWCIEYQSKQSGDRSIVRLCARFPRLVFEVSASPKAHANATTTPLSERHKMQSKRAAKPLAGSQSVKAHPSSPKKHRSVVVVWPGRLLLGS